MLSCQVYYMLNKICVMLYDILYIMKKVIYHVIHAVLSAILPFEYYLGYVI